MIVPVKLVSPVTVKIVLMSTSVLKKLIRALKMQLATTTRALSHAFVQRDLVITMECVKM